MTCDIVLSGEGAVFIKNNNLFQFFPQFNILSITKLYLYVSVFFLAMFLVYLFLLAFLFLINYTLLVSEINNIVSYVL